jgi:hypothetical protein
LKTSSSRGTVWKGAELTLDGRLLMKFCLVHIFVELLIKVSPWSLSNWRQWEARTSVIHFTDANMWTTIRDEPMPSCDSSRFRGEM